MNGDPQKSQFFSARELAELAKSRGISNFPHTERGVRDVAAREGWSDQPGALCRKRPGRGGGLEFHYSLLPENMRNALDYRDVQAVTNKRHNNQALADQAKLDAVRSHALSPRARAVMEARAEILTSIEGYAIANGQRRAWGISRFLEAQDEVAKRQEIEARRDQGQFLTDREAESLAYPLLLTANDGFQLDPERLSVANDRKKAAAIKRSTFYNWFKTRAEHGVIALAPTPPKSQADLHPGFAGFLKFYAKPAKPSASKALEDYLDTDPPKDKRLSLSQVQYILRNRLDNIEKNVGREGLLTLRSRLPFVRRTTEGMSPTIMYSADGKTFDAEIADPVTQRAIRPEITSVIDVATRKCVGYALSRKENVIAVTEALRRSCSCYGICAIFYVDRGPGYKNKTFDADVSGLMGRLSITKMHARAYNSQAKGIIERLNHVWNDLAKILPTYIGADMDKEAKSKIHKLTRKELKEFGVSQTLPTWDAFVQLCDETIEAYNDRPHRGLPKFEDPVTGRRRHMTPNECWAAHVTDGFEPITVEPEEADDLFRPYEIRMVRRGEVQWNTNTYFHHGLGRYHEEKVMVGYDYHQADRVWIREYDVSSGQPGKLICVAEFMGNAQRYVPVSYEQKAQENRTDGKLRLIKRREDDALAERDMPGLIEHMHEVPLPDLDTSSAADLQAEAHQADPNIVEIATPRRQTWASDEELALWALENPDDVTPRQAKVLLNCLERPLPFQAFQLAGIDTEALRTLLRAVA